MTRGKATPQLLSEDDKKIWRSYAKEVKRVVPQEGLSPPPFTEDVRHRITGEELSAPKPYLLRKPPNGPPRKEEETKPARRHLPPTAATQDRKTERALRSGDIALDAKLDLHGMTQDKAFVALEKFMAASVRHGHRNLLVITGKGSKGQSVLRSNLPQWLINLPCGARIRSVRFAAPKHGGEGAFYVLLKKRKD